jgi:RNA polymerase sigma-70 factor (ECF subfamily)
MQRPHHDLGAGEADQLAEAALAEERLLRAEDRAALHRALGRVPESFRMVVVLFDMQGMSYDEIAQSLQVPVGTVKSRLKRGRDALREAIFRQQGATRPTGNEDGHEHDRL